MKRLQEELRIIRQQMEMDFLLHSERISAQKQSVERVEQALEMVNEDLVQVKTSLSKVSDAIEKAIENTQAVFGNTQDSVARMSREFRDYMHTTRSDHETWASERKRNLRMLDVIQTGLLTSGIETEHRFEKVEQRLTRLEDNQSGAA